MSYLWLYLRGAAVLGASCRSLNFGMDWLSDMARPPPHNAAYYRQREREIRALAEAMSDATVRKQLHNIAEEYT
jgi:hypothetical protein